MASERTRTALQVPDEHTAEQSHHPETCGCGRDHQHEHHHHHDDGCACGHEHEHHHHHDDSCACGHEHEHHHHHDDGCACGQEHSHGQEHRHRTSAHGIKRVYTLQNLGCAHCAAEMQRQISQLDGVDDCVLVYETKQLRVTGKNPDALLPRIREICQSIESETQVIASEDEAGTGRSHPLAGILIGAGLFLAGELALGGMPKAVSYTHLDVYKRQA